MKSTQKAFFDNLEELRKINLASMFPGISAGELCFMKTMGEELRSAQPVRVSDIVEGLQVPAPAVSRTLKGMEQKGLIQRRVDETDRRNTFVEFTEEGTLLAEQVEREMSAFADAVFRQIGEDSFKQMNTYMHQLIKVSKEEISRRKTEKKGE